MISLYTETNLAGHILENCLPTATTLRVKFYNKNNPKKARIPQKQRLRLTLSRGQENQEEILVGSHETVDGITTLTLFTRKLSQTGSDMTGQESGEYHSEGASCESVEGHFPSNVMEDFFNGNSPTFGDNSNDSKTIKAKFETEKTIFTFHLNGDTELAEGGRLLVHGDLLMEDTQGDMVSVRTMASHGSMASIDDHADVVLTTPVENEIFMKTSNGWENKNLLASSLVTVGTEAGKIPVLGIDGLANPLVQKIVENEIFTTVLDTATQNKISGLGSAGIPTIVPKDGFISWANNKSDNHYHSISISANGVFRGGGGAMNEAFSGMCPVFAGETIAVSIGYGVGWYTYIPME